jgi:hypothetical protein
MCIQNNLSSRPERSEVERPAVAFALASLSVIPEGNPRPQPHPDTRTFRPEFIPPDTPSLQARVSQPTSQRASAPRTRPTPERKYRLIDLLMPSYSYLASAVTLFL